MATVAGVALPVGGTRSAHAARTLVPCLLAAAAGLHLWAANAHREESWLLALSLLGAGALQLWAASVVIAGSGRTKGAVVIGNLFAVGVWCLSRLVGLPFGPHAGVPEAVSALDAVTVAVELAALTGVVLLPRRPARRRGGDRPAAPKLVAWSCLYALGVGAILGGGDHARAHGQPADADVPGAGQPAGARFDFHPQGHVGPCDLFHPCGDGDRH